MRNDDGDQGKGKEKPRPYRELCPEERRPLMTASPQARASCWQVFQRQPTDIFIFVALGSALGATISILTNERVISLFELEEVSSVSVMVMSIVTTFLLLACLALQDQPSAHHLYYHPALLAFLSSFSSLFSVILTYMDAHNAQGRKGPMPRRRHRRSSLCAG